MIYNFSNYLALLAAIYFTMSLDKVLTKKIWTNDYFQNFEEAIKKSSAIAESIAKNIIKNTQTDVEDIQSQLIKKSVYMLSIVAMVLAFCGFEQNHISDRNIIDQMQIAISGTAIVSFVFFNIFLSKHVYAKWWLLVLAIGINVVLYISLIQWGNLLSYPVLLFLKKYSSEIVVAYFALPVLWQIWVCFVYRAIYPMYINDAIVRISFKFKIAEDCIKSGDIESMPKEYRKVFEKHTLKDKTRTVQEVIDSSMDAYVSVLQDEIQQAGINVDAHQIVFRRLKQKLQDVWEWFRKGIKRTPTSPKVGEDTILTPATTPSEQETIARYGYDALKNEYEASGKSMDDFCKEKGISKTEFEKHIKSK